MAVLLDLFCGGGGAAWGYHLAGWDVVGVDVSPQPDYPFTMYRADALTFPLDGWDAVHASPPCKLHTRARSLPRPPGPARLPELPGDHDRDCLGPMLDRLADLGVPWVVENVPGAPMPDPVTYCGSAFGLRVRRHRWFTSNIHLEPPPCDHARQAVPVPMVFGHGGGRVKGNPVLRGADAAAALGITHTERQASLSQAIPPAYTRHIGRELRRVHDLLAGR